MIYTDINFLILSLFTSASLFFLMVGIRELNEICLEGFLYLTLAFFFGVSHYIFLINLPISSPLSFETAGLSFWGWLTLLIAPSLIILFIVFGIFNFLRTRFQFGLIKIYFGLTLICFLYMLGSNWPIDVKGMITIVFCYIWFEVEFKTAH